MVWLVERAKQKEKEGEENWGEREGNGGMEKMRKLNRQQAVLHRETVPKDENIILSPAKRRK